MKKLSLGLYLICSGTIIADDATLPLAPPATVELPLASAAPVIDGDLDDPCWSKAFATADFRVFKHPDTADGATTLRMTADRAWLYLGFDCTHPDPADMRTEIAKNDTGGVFGDECVKVFIFPGHQGLPYFRYVLNPRNTHDFSKNVSPSPAWPVDPPWPSAVSINARGWRAELAVPLAYLAAHGLKSSFRISAFRHKIVKQIEAEVVVGEMETTTCWPAHLAKWVEYDRLAAVRGIDPRQIQSPFLATVTGAAVGRYRATAAGLFYDVRLDLQPLAGQTGLLTIAVTDRPAAGAGRTITQTVACAAAGGLTIPVPVDNADARDVSLSLRNAGNGALLGNYTIADTAVLTMLRVYADRSYYTTETAARLICEIGLDAEALQGYALMAECNAATVGRIDNPTPHCVLPVALGKMPQGDHQLGVSLVDRSGRKLTAQPLPIVKRPAKPGFEVKIDRENRIILRDGAPYFPLGFLWDAPPAELHALGFDAVATAGERFNQAADIAKVAPMLQEAARNGVQVVMRTDTWGERVETLPTLEKHFAPEEIKKILHPTPDISHSLLMRKYWARGEVFAKLPRQERTAIYSDYFETVRPLIASAMRTAAGHSNLLAHMNIDEPGRADLRHYDILAVCRKIYEMARTLDGYRPVMGLFPSVIPNDREALAIADIIITDPYWIPGRAGDNGINHVSKIVALQERRCAPEHKVCMVAPLASWWSMTHKRALTHDEILCQTYLALIHGAKGLMFWRYNYVAHQAQWDAYTRLGREIPELAPALLAPAVAQEIRYAPVAFAPDQDTFPDVQVRLLQAPPAGFILLAANSMNYPVKTQFTVAGLSGKVGRVFSGAEFQVEQETFADNLEPLAIRAYRLGKLEPAHHGESDRGGGAPAPLTPDRGGGAPAPLTPDRGGGAPAPGAGSVPTAGPAVQPIIIRVAMQPDKSAAQPEIAISSRGRPGKRNLLLNPSFEENTLPLWPDYYRIGKSTPPVGHPDAPWTLVEGNPFHGRYCLRIKGKKQFRFNLAPLEPAPAGYVFSVYLRTDRPRADIWFSICGTRQTLKVSGAAWQRQSFPVIIPANADEKFLSQIQPLSEDATVWLDAMQFEKGTTPTEFEP